jgi:molybdopterin converting factor small subunit
MTVSLHLPPSLALRACGQSILHVEAAQTVDEALAEISRKFPGLLDRSGTLRVLLNGIDILYLQGRKTHVQDDDTILLVETVLRTPTQPSTPQSLPSSSLNPASLPDLTGHPDDLDQRHVSDRLNSIKNWCI